MRCFSFSFLVLLPVLFFSQGLFQGLWAQNSPQEKLSLSILQIPVLYSEKELENSLNRHYLNEGGIFCNDDSFINFNNDHLKNLCRQKDRIKITIEDGEVVTTVPIQIEAVYLIEKQFFLNLGIYKKTFRFKLERNIDFGIKVTFKTKVYLDNNLKLIPNTTWSFDWLSYPSIKFGIFSLRVTDVAMGAIARTLEEYANDRINKTLVEEINIPDIINIARETVETPFLLDSEREIWSYVDLKNMRAGQIELKEGNIQFYFEADFYSYLAFNFVNLVGLAKEKNRIRNKFLNTNSSNTVFNIAKGPPISASEKTNHFDMDFSFKVSAVKLENLISDVLAKESIKIGTGENSLEVNEIYIRKIGRFVETDVYLKNNNPDNPLQALSLALKFIPYYDLEAKKIRVRNVSYVLDSESNLVNWGSVLFQNSIKEALEDNVSFSIERFMNDIQKSLNTTLTSVEIDSQKQLEVVVEKLKVKDVRTEGNFLVLYLNTNGRAQLQLKNMF